MAKKSKNKYDNLYNFSDTNIYMEKYQNDQEEQKRIKAKQREKRIKQQKQQEKDTFDLDTEMVIGMTNRNNQRNREEIQRKKTKKQAQIIRKKKRIKRIIKWTTLLLLIIGGVVFALVSPIFNIKDIKVINNEQIATDTIISLSELQLDQNLFRYNRNKVIKNIKTNPYVESVQIKRKIPNKVEITIKERQKNYNIEFLNGYAYINNQGYILEISEQKIDVPVIQGISTETENIVEGNRLNEQDLSKLEVVIQIMSICKNYELDKKISKIDISDKTNYSIYMEEEKKTVYLGDESNLSNKMLYVPTILSENQDKEGEIYLNGDLNNNFKPRFKEKV